MNKDICLVSPACYNFAQYLYPILDCDFSYMNEPPNDASTVILFGVFLSTGSPLRPFAKAKRKIAIWVGTDVMQMESYLKGHQGEHEDFNKHIDIKLADAVNLAAELEDLGILMDGVVETPPKVILKPVELPKDFTVGVYAPVKREAHYFTELCLEIAKAMPDVQFRLYGLNREFGKIADNVYDIGQIDVAKEMPGFSALIRFTIHDGIAVGPVEFMQAGRRVVTNLDIPFASRCEPDLDSAVKALRAIQKKTEPDKAASHYWRERLSHQRWREEIEKYI